MTLSTAIVDQVRKRAPFACAYCGVAETDCGGQLSVDHFQPRTRGGADDLSNLLYCCYRCNLYKADYWPDQPGRPLLWNPRQELMETHLLTLADGKLYPVTAIGQFTLQRLRLNRPPLVAHRLQRRTNTDQAQVLKQYKELLVSLNQLFERLQEAVKEHHALLSEQRAMMRSKLRSNGQQSGGESLPK